ncbi:hypothetical protein PO903_18700 [Paenibacillus sp. PK4536]|uniref:hypothetical protein n=1 Tax=Paenibacillus sp. PK4536 TaxID=3024576 RepID=UPI0023592114|nr:hypothetical protein [Paenibacillus sp. PK4536]WIM38660.1 hypothetical protein PO903_18700 [Paenibacillus sp. PK4536]
MDTYPPYQDPYRKEGRNRFGLALTSFILGIISFFTSFMSFAIIGEFGQEDSGFWNILLALSAFVAIVLLILVLTFSLISIRTTHGRAFAITGLVLGSVQILFVLLLIFVVN